MPELTDPGKTQDNQTEERPPWLPENFKSPQDLATSYSEATKKITSQGQELSDLREQVESLSDLAASLQQQHVAPASADPAEALVAQYEQAMVSGDYRTVLAIQAQVAALVAQAQQQQFQTQQQPTLDAYQAAQREMIANQAESGLRTSYSDWNDYSDRVAEEIERRPDLLASLQQAGTPTAFASVLDSAYRLVKYDELESGRRELEEKEAAKRAAQTATGQGPGRIQSPDEDKAEWEQIKSAGSRSPWTK